ncbi:InlB B-repeat-containing protein [Stomatobaculum sp. F0698]|uniref:InlB B-repeat-containing protein n=1 Tax=Stomatobaculum sp. F0698 TaxID=3059030 RepID=UPI00272CA06A|nr:InlB B-repeat-containing protein [Stomatobaculum sp. F0698]WLD87189.1 InlB B-repeat-containing protein [Stomatobaculum sp. F0698]
MRKRRNWSKRLLAGMLSAAMVALNVSTATPAFAALSAEEFREDAELINDLALPKDVRRQLQAGEAASPSDAGGKQDLLAGSKRWGTPSNATKVLHTRLDGVDIEVSAPAGVLPEGASLKARNLTEAEEKEVLAKINEHAEASGKSATAQFLCDLTVLNAAGEEIQPDNTKGTLAVSFRNVTIVSAASAETGAAADEVEQNAVSVLHIDEANEKVDTLRAGLNENTPVLQAAAEHFSPFAVVNYTPTSATPLPLSVAFQRLDYDDDNRLAYKLKDVTVTDTPGTGITSMNFQVDTGSIELLSTPTGVQTFTDILSAHKFYQIIFPTALTPADAQTFIENNIKFHLPSAGATQQVKITLGNGANNLPTGATITKAIIPNPVAGDGAEHYYMYVEPVANTEISWAESYNLAKSYKLNGMQGYLATITSQSEDRTLDNITMKGAWSGGARLEGVNDASSVPNWYDNSTAGVTGVFSNLLQHGNTAGGSWHQWRWQDGPETNTEFYEANGRGAINGAYTNWGPGQPDSANMPGTSYKEGFMQVHHGTGTWNDLPNLNNWHPAIYVFGFFVEFSSYNQNATTVDQSIPLVTSDVAYVEVGGQRHYFSNLDDAIAWSSQNGNPAITLTNNTVVTQNIPAGVVINTNGKTLGVPAGSNVTNNGTINVTGGSSFLVQGANGGFTNAGSGAVNVPLTITVKPRTVTATETLTWDPSHVTATGLIGNDRVTGVSVNFDNSQPVATTTTDNATPLAPTTFDNGAAGSAAIGTYTITYVPGPVTRNPHQYTVKFVANAPAGQTATGTMADQTITGSTGTANLTNHFAVNGYTFNGWTGSNGQTYADGATPANLVTTNNGVITMTANWTENNYNIQYTTNVNPASRTAGAAVNPNTVTSYKVTDPNVAIQPMTWPGYNFDGWYDNQLFAGTPVSTLVTSAVPAGDKHYYAKWTAKNYNLAYHLNDSAAQPANNPDAGFTTYTAESPDHTFGTPTRPGYTFLGWFTDAGLTTAAPATLLTAQGDTNPTDLFAKWSAPLPYSITYVLNDTTPAGHTASNPAANPGGFDVTDPSINLQAPTRTGYTFLGWYADAGLTTPISSINPATAVNYTVYAKWSAPNAYNVQWTLNDTVPAGLTAVNPNALLTSYTVEDADYTLRPATRTGYTFENWYDNAALTGTPVTTLHTMDAEDKHYYAKWGNALSYPITYVMNDSATSPATAVTPNSYTVEDADFALGIPTRNGASFQGWYDNAALTGTPITTLHTADAAAKTYYAKWQLNSYSINYNLNPGTGIGTPTNPASNVPSFTVDDDVQLAPPVRRGYTGSWSLNGQTVTSIPAGTTGQQNLTANWTLNHYNITYDTGETANSPVQGLGTLPTSYTIEDATITLPTPSRIGYTFSHWEKVTAPGVADNQILSGSDGDVAFKAVWEPIRYRITYDTAGGVNDAANPTTFTIEDEINPNGAVKQGVKFWTWKVVGGKFLNTIPAGTTHDVALVAVYQTDRDGENAVGGSGGSGGGGGGGGSRSSGRRGTVTPNNVATGTPSATQPNNTQPNTTPNQGEDKKPVIEPSPQKNADTLDKGNALSQDGGKRATNRGTAVGSNKDRLPKTGEAPFALNFAGTAAGFLLAAYAVLGRRRKER